MTAFGNFAATALDFVAILLMFSHVDALGGFSLPEVAFLYGTSGDRLRAGRPGARLDGRLGRRVRDGTLDTLLVRPVPVLAQVAADRFALRRLGRITQGAAGARLGADPAGRRLDGAAGADGADDGC